MTPSPRAPSLSLVLLDTAGAAKPPAALERAVAQGWALDLICAAASSFDRVAPAFAAALAKGAGDYVFAVTPDQRLSDDDWKTLAAALGDDPDADAFRLALQGLPHGPGWRGRRCR